MPTPRVLVADDNALSLRFLSAALESLGYAFTAVVDGERAVEQALNAAFDLLLLDARMPRLDGPGALQRIRSSGGPSRVSIALATTADDAPTTHTALLDAGFAEVLVKPLTMDVLGRALARHLQGSNSLAFEPALDDARALAAVGGDASIVAALRRLLIDELAALPEELDAISERRDANALRERLHRLDASAGFCGVPALTQAAKDLRDRLSAPAWPSLAIAEFLDICARAGSLLKRSSHSPP